MNGMGVLLQVVSVSSRERNWSAHWHIFSKVCNKLNPAAIEKLVYVYTNCKIESETRVDGDLKMFAWDDKETDVQALNSRTLCARFVARVRACARAVAYARARTTQQFKSAK